MKKILNEFALIKKSKYNSRIGSFIEYLAEELGYPFLR